MSSIQPFHVDIPDEALDRIRARAMGGGDLLGRGGDDIGDRGEADPRVGGQIFRMQAADPPGPDQGKTHHA